MGPVNSEPAALLEHLFRHQAGRMVAHFSRIFGPAHIQLAEDAVQEAMLRALQSWPYQGVPENPPAWLFRAAHNSAIDTLRRKRLLGEKTEQIAATLVQSVNTITGDRILKSSCATMSCA